MSRGLDIVGYDTRSRRHFLRAASGVALALPFLETLFPARRALAAGTARRFIFLFNGHGQVDTNWFPSDSLAFDKFAGHQVASLASIAGEVSPTLSAHWNSLKDRFTVIRGLDYCTGSLNHRAERLLLGGTGGGGRVTMDHVIAKFLSRTRGHEVTSTVLQNGVDKGYASFTASGAVTGVTRSTQFFESLFGLTPPAQPPASGSPVDTAPSGPSPLLAQKKAVDHVYGEYKALLSDPRLSTLDKQRVQEHMTFVSELQSKIFANVGGGAGEPPANGGGSGPRPPVANCSSPTIELPAKPTSPFDHNLSMFIETIILAARCGKTPVVNLMMHPYEYGDYNLAPEIGVGGDPHNDIGHSAGESHRKMMEYYGNKVARLVAGLAGVQDPEGGGSLLDTSIILWGNDMGASVPSNHGDYNLPVLLAGGASGPLNMGKYIDYSFKNRRWANDGPSRPYNQLLVSIMLAMGMKESDWTSQPGSGFGVYGGNVDKLPASDLHRTQGLPGLMKA